MKKVKTVVSVAIAAFLAVTTGCGVKELSAGNVAIPEINAQPNEDGYYNLITIVSDQEHYFTDYPAGTSFKARELLKEINGNHL